MRQPADTEWKRGAAQEGRAQNINKFMTEGGRDGGKKTTKKTKGMRYADATFNEGVENNSHHKK